MANQADTASRRFTDRMSDKRTRIDAGIRIEGTIAGSVPVDVSGTVEGTIDVADLVWLRPDAQVRGQVHAESVVVEGRLDGTLKARDRVELRSSCRVEGDVDAASVAIAEGSFFEGRIRMSGARGAAKGFAEKRKPSS